MEGNSEIAIIIAPLGQRLDAAILRLQKLASENLPYGTRVNAEQEYAIAYDALVKARARPRLRRKYRLG